MRQVISPSLLSTGSLPFLAERSIKLASGRSTGSVAVTRDAKGVITWEDEEEEAQG